MAPREEPERRLGKPGKGKRARVHLPSCFNRLQHKDSWKGLEGGILQLFYSWRLRLSPAIPRGPPLSSYPMLKPDFKDLLSSRPFFWLFPGLSVNPSHIVMLESAMKHPKSLTTASTIPGSLRDVVNISWFEKHHSKPAADVKVICFK